MLSAHPAVPATNTRLPVSRWMVVIAHLAALTMLPSGLWRLPLAVGVNMGMSQAWMDQLHLPGWGSAYVLTLSTLGEVAAFLAIGLVRPWGETFPRWMPLIGGRPVRRQAAVAAATAGGLFVTVVSLVVATNWGENMAMPESPTGNWAVLMTACYAPILAWGPLLLIATAGYHLRRRRAALAE